MIGRLRGTLVRKEPPALLIDVGGVGYELEAPMTTFYELPPVGETVSLHTHLIVREDAHLLYGFARDAQRRQFRALLKVNGIGPRAALAVLSGLNEEQLVRCIAEDDVQRLLQVPGIGRKTAERLIVELRDKLALAGPSAPPSPPADGAADPAAEAVSARMALGNTAPEAARSGRALSGQGLATEELIRQALKSMVR